MSPGFDLIAKSFLPEYIGCYKDNETRAMELWPSIKNRRIESCIRLCASYNYLYAGVQVTRIFLIASLCLFLRHKHVFQCIFDLFFTVFLRGIVNHKFVKRHITIKSSQSSHFHFYSNEFEIINHE